MIHLPSLPRSALKVSSAYGVSSIDALGHPLSFDLTPGQACNLDNCFLGKKLSYPIFFPAICLESHPCLVFRRPVAPSGILQFFGAALRKYLSTFPIYLRNAGCRVGVGKYRSIQSRTKPVPPLQPKSSIVWVNFLTKPAGVVSIAAAKAVKA